MKTFKHNNLSFLKDLFKKAKPLTIILLLLFSGTFCFAQCHLRLSIQTIDATCQANGEIHCSLADTAGEKLEQIKYYYTKLDGRDTISETSLPAITQLTPGIYKVKVAALCKTGLAHENAYDIISDSLSDIAIKSSYQIPSCGIIYNLYNIHAPYGIVPSLTCENTGKVQVKIEKGVFPYTLEVWQIREHDTLYLRSVTYEAPQGTSTDPNTFEFQDYYTIDHLGVGDYLLRCHDGCGYHMPSMFVTIPKVKFCMHQKSIILRNSSFNLTDSNIVFFKTNFQKEDFIGNTDYYLISHSGFEYRFVNPTLSGGSEYTNWQALPDITLGDFAIADTLQSLHNYGELWGKNILLHIRPTACSDTLFEWYFTIYPVGGIMTTHNRKSDIIHFVPEHRDNCGITTDEIESDKYSSSIVHSRPQYYCKDSIGCRNTYGYTYERMTEDNLYGMGFHCYATSPIRYKISDITRNEVIATGTSIDITDRWFVSYVIDKQYDGDSIITELTDAHGCPIESHRFKYQDYLGHFHDGPYLYPTNWFICDTDNDCICPDCRHSFGLYQVHGLTTSYTSQDIEYPSTYFCDTIRLISSPGNNFYNFKASSHDLGQWDVIRDNEANKASIYYEDYKDYTSSVSPAIWIADTNLLGGEYIFVIDHACDRKPDTIHIYMQDYKTPEIIEQPIYVFDTSCTRLDIRPIAGAMALNGKPIKTYFQYFTNEDNVHTINAIEKGGTLSIGTPGEYRLAMYALPDDNANLLPFNSCYVKDTIIHWDEHTIEFDNLISYVCRADDQEGFVHARGKNGTLPYHYKVYSETDGHGVLLAENDIGDFEHLPIHFQQQLSIEMIDNCDAHFITNFTVNDMEAIRKGWAEDGPGQVEICEGEECHLYGLSIPQASYHWTGPNGFNDSRQNPSFFIPRHCPCAGMYHLTINGSGCGPVQDSIYISILEAPKLELSSKSTFCLGEELQIFATPTGRSPISYTLSFAGSDRRLTVDHRISGQKDTIGVGQSTAVQIVAIEDKRCRYDIPEDYYHLHISNSLPQNTLLEKTIQYDETPYLWDNHLFTREDTLITTYTSSTGCDSTVTHILHIVTPKICPTATDYDGHKYPSVLIDKQCWLQKNLRSRHYSDGRIIKDCHPYLSYVYSDALDNEEKFGLLYNYAAATDPGNIEHPQQGACPTGWRLPTSADYDQLFTHGFKALRSDKYWIEGRGGNNNTGFSALPAGYFNQKTNRYENLLGETRFWTQNGPQNSENVLVFQQKDDCFLQILEKNGSHNKYSIRCILEE